MPRILKVHVIRALDWDPTLRDVDVRTRNIRLDRDLMSTDEERRPPSSRLWRLWRSTSTPASTPSKKTTRHRLSPSKPCPSTIIPTPRCSHRSKNHHLSPRNGGPAARMAGGTPSLALLAAWPRPWASQSRCSCTGSSRATWLGSLQPGVSLVLFRSSTSRS